MTIPGSREYVALRAEMKQCMAAQEARYQGQLQALRDEISSLRASLSASVGHMGFFPPAPPEVQLRVDRLMSSKWGDPPAEGLEPMPELGLGTEGEDGIADDGMDEESKVGTVNEKPVASPKAVPKELGWVMTG